MAVYCAFIDGQKQQNKTGETFITVNPATGDVLAEVQLSDEWTISKAITSAQKGSDLWRNTEAKVRAKVLAKAANLLRLRNKELAELEVMDTGKPIQEAISVDIHSAADCLEYYAHLAPTLTGDYVDLSPSFAYVRREPLGICVGIGAWNYPIQIAAWKSAPALCCGNAMIFKPSELSPLSTIKLAEIYQEAGLPDGVFNVVLGDSIVGQKLCQHKAVAKISLTGAVETGKKVMASAGMTLKKVTFELGGKSPLIIFPDADLDEAVSASMIANFYSQGEICSNGTRVFVHQEIEEAFLQKLVARTKKLKVGMPLDKTTQIGALISKSHLDKVLAYVASGIKEGATLLCGGAKCEEAPLMSGHFMSPAIFTHCHDNMTIVKEEIFGPVMSVLTFKTEKEVIKRANKTDYGLASGIFTRNLQRAHRVAAQLEAGVCWVNNYNITPVELPFGGNKHSGMGRENGHAAIAHYTQLKTVYVEMEKVDCPYE